MIRIAIADDHCIFREGLARLLSDHADFDVVAQAGYGAELINTLREHRVDLAILDLVMPGGDGIDLIAHLKEVRPTLKILVVTMQSGEYAAVRALRAGADGYMTKETAASDLVAAIRQIHGGSRYVCPMVAERMALGMASGGAGRKAHECLSEREFRIFQMLVAGKRGAQIASELALSEKTVSTHKTHVLRKLDLQSSSDLVRYAIRHELVSV